MKNSQRISVNFLVHRANQILLLATVGLSLSFNVLGQDVWQPLGPAGVRVRSMAIDPQTPTTLYIGTGTGPDRVLKSSDGGVTWTAAAAGLPGSTVKVLVIDPASPQTLYAGNDGGGVFKSTNGGDSWFDINNGLDASSDVTALAIDPDTPSTLYMRGTDNDGVYKTTDGGSSWIAANVGLPDDDIPVLVVNPRVTTTIYAGFDGEGVFKSIDGGASWVAARTGLSLDIVTTLVINPQAPSTLYAGGLNFDSGTGQADGGGVFKSIDGGNNWVAAGLADFSINALAIAPNRPDKMYCGTEGQGVFVSNDGGTSWSGTSTGLTNLFIKALATDSQGMVYAGSPGDGLFKAQDVYAGHDMVFPHVFNLDNSNNTYLYVQNLSESDANDVTVTYLGPDGIAKGSEAKSLVVKGAAQFNDLPTSFGGVAQVSCSEDCTATGTWNFGLPGQGSFAVGISPMDPMKSSTAWAAPIPPIGPNSAFGIAVYNMGNRTTNCSVGYYAPNGDFLVEEGWDIPAGGQTAQVSPNVPANVPPELIGPDGFWGSLILECVDLVIPMVINQDQINGFPTPIVLDPQ
jgi:photosystem II stability/assembly factor-like uncharacterized protein